MTFISISLEESVIPCSYSASLSHLTYCTPTKSNLYLANSLATVISDPDLYWLLTLQVPNVIPLFRCLGYTKESVQVQCFVKCFITW
jgi:hypothetical protein